MSITKFGKKMLCFVAFLLMVFGIVACNTNTVDEAKKTATEHLEAIYKMVNWDESAYADITKDLILNTKTRYDDTTVEWTSSHPDIIATNGVVTRPSYDHKDAVRVDPTSADNKNNHVEVTLTAKITTTYGEGKTLSKDKVFKFTVLCESEGLAVGTIADVKAKAYKWIYEDAVDADGNSIAVAKEQVSNSKVTYSVKVTAKVTAILNASGAGQFMIHDGTAGIYVYSTLKDIVVGDTVTVVGDIYSYYGSLQIGSNISVKKVDDREDIVIPEYKEVSIDEWEKTWSNKETLPIGYLGGDLITVTAKLENTKNAATSDMYRLVDPFTGEEAWIYYKSYNEEQEAVLKSFDGKFVKITGVTYDRDTRSQKNHILWDGGIEEVSAPELTTEQKIANVKANIEKLAGSYASGVALVLPTEFADYNATVEWNVPTDAPYENGKFTIVTADTKVVFTATIKVGDKTENVEIEITVKPVEKVTIAAATKLAKGSVVKIEGVIETMFGSAGNLYVKDSTGTILVYVKTNFKATVNGVEKTLKAGDKVTFTGTTNVFNGTPQIGSIISWDAHEEGTWKQSSAVKTTVADICAYTSTTALYGEYLQVKGVIVKDEKGYFWLAENTAEDAKKVSLFSSTVPEEYKALAGTDTQVTLFFYFYGNSKADFSGDFRVIYSGREGEQYIGDAPIVEPSISNVLLTVDTLGLVKSSYQDGTATINGVSFSFVELGNFGNGIQLRTKDKTSSFANTTAFSKGITKIVFKYNSEKAGFSNANALAVKFGTDATVASYSTFLSTEKGVTEYVITPDVATYTFVSFTINITYSMYFESIEICFDGGSTPTPDPKPDPEPDPEPKPEIKTTFAVKSFAELTGMVPEEGNATSEKFYVAGYVKEIKNDKYGNVYIEDKDGNTFYIYGMYDVTGKTRFDELGTNQPKVGDVVVLYGIVKNFKGTIEMENGWLVQLNTTVFEQSTPTPDPDPDPKPEPDPEPTSGIEIDLTAQGYENEFAVESLTVDGVTVTFNKGSNPNVPKFYSKGNAVRVYGGAYFTVDAGEKKIAKIVITFGSGDQTNEITVDAGEFATNTWTGDASTVKFTVGGTKGHRRIAKITVVLA